MTSRRGSSRGQVIRSPVFPSSASSSDSSDSGSGRVAAPSSRRGRGHGKSPSSSAARVRLTSNLNFHSAHFNYPCTINHQDFIASVSIRFRTNLTAQAQPSAPSGIAPDPEDGILFYPPGVSLQGDQGATVSQHELLHARPSAPSGSDFSGKLPPPPEDDDFNPYACPVVEEAPSPTNDA